MSKKPKLFKKKNVTDDNEYNNTTNEDHKFHLTATPHTGVGPKFNSTAANHKSVEKGLSNLQTHLRDKHLDGYHVTIHNKETGEVHAAKVHPGQGIYKRTYTNLDEEIMIIEASNEHRDRANAAMDQSNEHLEYSIHHSTKAQHTGYVAEKEHHQNLSNAHYAAHHALQQIAKLHLSKLTPTPNQQIVKKYTKEETMTEEYPIVIIERDETAPDEWEVHMKNDATKGKWQTSRVFKSKDQALAHARITRDAEKAKPNYVKPSEFRVHQTGSAMRETIDLGEDLIDEDGVPGNCAGGGQVAGIGVGKDGEPGVKKKKVKEVVMAMVKRKMPN